MFNDCFGGNVYSFKYKNKFDCCVHASPVKKASFQKCYMAADTADRVFKFVNISNF